MAVRVVRLIKRIARDNALDWTITAFKTLSDVSPVPPLTTAMKVVLSILQIISDVKTNQQGCFLLVQRTIGMLVFLQKHMEGKRDAPQSLLDDIREFEDTLRSIHKFMFQLTKMNSFRRGLEKSRIQDELLQHEQKLNEAERRFQYSSLMEMRCDIRAIHTMIGASPNNPPGIPDQSVVTNTMECSLSSLGGYPSKCSVSSSKAVNQFRDYALDYAKLPSSAIPIPTEEDEFLANMTGDTDEFGFRRYHQSDVVIRKSNGKAVGWFSGTSDADVCGRKVTIKRYNGEKNLALKQWVRDIKALRNLHHENLPQILGYSNGKAPVPFILLASVQNRDFAQVMRSALATYSLADCATLILKTYREVASAIAHATQQLSLSGQDAHDFVHRATYSVDSDNTVIVGLPPTKETWLCHYHSLEQSMSFLTLQYLRDLRDEKQAAVQANSSQSVASYKKYNQLLALLGSLLPHDGDRPCLSTELEALLDDVDRDNAHILHDLWTLSLEQSRYGPTSIATAPVGVLAVGDYGYNPGDPLNFRDFIALGNIQDGENGKEMMRAVSEAHCMMYMDGHDTVSCPVSLSVIPDGSECWHVALPPETTGKVSVSHETRLASVKDALQFLVAYGTSLASRHGIEPQDLIVVTRSERYELYDTSGWLPPATRSAIGLGSTTPSTLAPYHQHRAQASSDPSMVYLVTSSRPDFGTYVTDELLHALAQDHTGSASWCLSCIPEDKREIVNYIRPDAEDVWS